MEKREYEEFLHKMNIDSIEEKMVDVFANKIRHIENCKDLEDEFLIFMLKYPEFSNRMGGKLGDSFIMDVGRKLNRKFNCNFWRVYEIGKTLLENDLTIDTLNNIKECNNVPSNTFYRRRIQQQHLIVINQAKNNILQDLASKLRNICNNYPNKIVAIFAFVFIYNIIFDPDGISLEELLKEAGLDPKLIEILEMAIRINTKLYRKKEERLRERNQVLARKVLGAHIESDEVVYDSESNESIVLPVDKVVIDKSLLEDLLDSAIRINSESADLARKINDIIKER